MKDGIRAIISGSPLASEAHSPQLEPLTVDRLKTLGVGLRSPLDRRTRIQVNHWLERQQAEDAISARRAETIYVIELTTFFHAACQRLDIMDARPDVSAT